MNRHRLEVLSKFLRTVPVEEFDIETWRSPCGTTACAVGWACTIPEFKEAGLLLRADDDGLFEPVFLTPNGELIDWIAVENFFDITRWAALSLFHYDAYAEFDLTPSDVADKIDTLLAGGAI